MDLLYTVERLHYYLKENNEINWEYVDELHMECDVSPRDMRKLIDYFLTNLLDNHQLPGNVYAILSGIGDYIRVHDNITSRQMNYVFANMATHLDQLDLFKSQI
jgi:hypothetical protein